MSSAAVTSLGVRKGADGSRFGDTYWWQGKQLPAADSLRDPARIDQADYKELADSLPTLCWIANADGYITWYNRRWHEYCGTTPEQMEGWGWQSVHDPDVLPAVMESWTASIASGEPFEMVFPLRGADGVFRPFLTRILPLRDEAGSVRRWIGNNIDISQQVAVEQELRRIQAELEESNRRLAEREAILRHNEERLRALVTASSDAVYSMNPDWTEMKQLDGRSFLADTDAPSIAWLDEYLLPEDQAAIRAVIDEAVATKSVFEMEHRVRAADGSIGWTFSRAVPVLGGDGVITEWFGMAADVTARHIAAAALRESEEFTRTVLESSTDCIKVLSLDGELEFMSDGGQRVMEISDFNEVRGCSWPRLLGAEGAPQAQEAIEAAKLGRTSHFECEANTFAGTPKWWNVSVSPVRDGDGKVTRILSVSRDHTELRDAHEQQELLNGELAHRLKNTLTVIQAIAFQTLSGSADQAALDAFGERISALSRAHDVLVRQSWSAASLREVTENVLGTFDEGGRITVSGPETVIGPRATLALSLLLHELATNATKHGALSVPEGHVGVTWSWRGDGDDALLTMCWRERGGPPAIEPSRRGFGSRIIRMGLSGSGGTTLRYGPEGLTAEMTATAAQLKQA